MPRNTMGPAAIKRISDAIDLLFDKISKRLLGRTTDKTIAIKVGGYVPELTLPALLTAAAQEERTKPSSETVNSLVEIAQGYINAQKETAKSRVVKEVDSWLQEASKKKIKTDLSTVLEGRLSEVFGKVEASVKKIVDTEATTARNIGTLEGITKIAAGSGSDDPVVIFIVVRDNSLCSECKRLHLLPDGITPRAWLLSEVAHSYHQKVDDFPSIGGEHPNCRCSLAYLGRGYGFVNGKIAYIGPDHDELKRQRS